MQALFFRTLCILLVTRSLATNTMVIETNRTGTFIQAHSSRAVNDFIILIIIQISLHSFVSMVSMVAITWIRRKEKNSNNNINNKKNNENKEFKRKE